MDLPAHRQLVGRLRYRQLALLAALGEHGNLHRAAAAVHITQPSATKLVRLLERLFGFPLFERLPHGMAPTALGSEVLTFAQHALGDLHRFTAELELRRRSDAGQLLIGTSPDAASVQMAGAIAQITRQHALRRIKLVGTHNDEELTALLLAHKIDLGLGHDSGSNRISYEPLGAESLYVVVRAGHPITRMDPHARAPGLQLRTLQKCLWILPLSPSPARHAIDQEFRQAALEMPARIIECSPHLAVLQLLHQSDALTVLPESVAHEHVQSGLLIRLPLELAQNVPGYGVLTRRGETLGSAALELIELLRHQARLQRTATGRPPPVPVPELRRTARAADSFTLPGLKGSC